MKTTKIYQAANHFGRKSLQTIHNVKTFENKAITRKENKDTNDHHQHVNKTNGQTLS